MSFMKRVLSLATVAVLMVCISLCAGCGKKDKDKSDGKGTTDSAGVTSVVEGMPSTSVETDTDSEGNIIYKEDIIPEDALNNPAEYNKEQNASQSTTTDKNNNSSVTSSVSDGKTDNKNNSSTDLEGAKDTDSGYSSDWIL